LANETDEDGGGGGLCSNRGCGGRGDPAAVGTTEVGAVAEEIW
jgi:hypothetical protein